MIEFDFTAPAGAFTLRARAKARTPGIVGLFGPSGAGKTTLLRAIAGLQPLQSGQIALDGAPLTEPPEVRRVAYVFQDSRLFPHLDVRENLLFGLKRAPTPHKLTLESVVDALGVAALMERTPRGLSGGEQKRVAIGRALLSQPRLILLDEPLAGVDDARKADIVALIADVHAKFDPAIMLVSHDLDEIAALSDDLLLIDGGAITHSGVAADIFADIASPLAERPDARCIIDGAVAVSDPEHGQIALTAGSAQLTLPWLAQPIGARVRLQVFARDVTLAAQAPDAISIQNILPAKVTAMRVRADKLALVALETPAGALLATITQQAAARMGLAPGAAVYALVKASALGR